MFAMIIFSIFLLLRALGIVELHIKSYEPRHPIQSFPGGEKVFDSDISLMNTVIFGLSGKLGNGAYVGRVEGYIAVFIFQILCLGF